MNEPTNRELKIMLDNLIQRQDERHSEVLNKLVEINSTVKMTAEAQQTTDSRLGKLEYWRTALIALVTGIISFMAFTIPFFTRYLRLEINETVDSSVNRSVSYVLDRYNITVQFPEDEK